MLVIRLSRTGRTKRPHYRIVVAEKSAAVKGRYLEVLGHFDPLTKELTINKDRAKARLEAGAKPSETAEMLLEKEGVLKREKISDKHRRPTRKPRKELKAEAEGDGAAPAAAPKEDTKPDDAKAEAKPAEAADTKAEEPKAEEAKPDEKPAQKEPEAKPKTESKPEEAKSAEKPADKEKGDS